MLAKEEASVLRVPAHYILHRCVTQIVFPFLFLAVFFPQDPPEGGNGGLPVGRSRVP